MTDIEAKALALVNEVLVEWGIEPRCPSIEQLGYAKTTALCRAIERHEAFKQEVSDAVEAVRAYYKVPMRELDDFDIPKPKPDPLVDIFDECFNQDVLEGETWSESMARKTKAALKARGLEIREKGQ
jgi:hypothetical protein